MLSRRHLLLQLLTGVCLVACSGLALAESGSGSNGSGGGDSGGGDSDSGSDNSGHGNNNDDDDDDGKDDDRDEVREAVRRGEATALRDILAKVKKKYAGEIVHVGLKKRSNRLVYTIKLIDRTGMLMLVRVDARNGTIIGEQGI
ncbi:MAG: PepSY domain-containing protein [Aestuariivirga sp.]